MKYMSDWVVLLLADTMTLIQNLQNKKNENRP